VLKKYANEAETFSVFYFSFISSRATGLRVC